MPTLEEEFAAAREAGRNERLAKTQARGAAATAAKEGDPALTKAGVSGSGDAFGLNLIDKGSLGLLPFVHDKLVDWAGEDRMGPRYRDIMGKVSDAYPIASTVGAVGGTILPFAGGARLAKAALGAGPMVAGAIGGGLGNAADQAVRTQTEDRPFDTTEALISGAVGGVGLHPAVAGLRAAKGALGGTVGRVGSAIADRVLPAASRAVGAELPEAGAAAARTILDDAAAASKTFKATPRAPAAEPGIPPRPAPEPPAAPPEPFGPPQRPAPPGFSREPWAPRAEPPPAAAPKPPPEPWVDLGAGDPLKPLPPGIRPGKIDQNSQLWKQLGAKVRGEPAPPPDPVAGPALPPGLLTRLNNLGGIPFGRLSSAAVLDNAIEAPRKRRRR